MPLHVSSTMCSSSGGQKCIIQHLESSNSVGDRPVHRLKPGTSPLSTCAPEGHLQVWWNQTPYNTILTYWWWAQQCSKQVEKYNKLIKKRGICALSWSISKIILRCTVRKTSKFDLLLYALRVSLSTCKLSPFFCFLLNKIKVKQYLYRPGQILRIPGGWCS